MLIQNLMQCAKKAAPTMRLRTSAQKKLTRDRTRETAKMRNLG